MIVGFLWGQRAESPMGLRNYVYLRGSVKRKIGKGEGARNGTVVSLRRGSRKRKGGLALKRIVGGRWTEVHGSPSGFIPRESRRTQRGRKNYIT